MVQKVHLKPRVPFLLPRQNICKKSPNYVNIGHFRTNYNEDQSNCLCFHSIITASKS